MGTLLLGHLVHLKLFAENSVNNSRFGSSSSSVAKATAQGIPTPVIGEIDSYRGFSLLRTIACKSAKSYLAAGPCSSCASVFKQTTNSAVVNSLTNRRT